MLAQKTSFLTDIAFAHRAEVTIAIAIGQGIMAKLLGKLGCLFEKVREMAREASAYLRT